MNIQKSWNLLFLISIVLISCKETDKKTTQTKDRKDTTSVSNIQTVPPSNVDNGIYADVDISPMDMSYFPVKYPQLKMTGNVIEGPVMRVIYSRPHLQGRKLFEDVLKYGVVWRLGANESTELDIFKPVMIDGKKLPEGRYTLYAVPHAGYWIVAINKNLDIWGLKQDSMQDIMRVQIPVTYYNPYLEYFTMVFEKTDTGANLVMGWDDAIAKLPIKF